MLILVLVMSECCVGCGYTHYTNSPPPGWLYTSTPDAPRLLVPTQEMIMAHNTTVARSATQATSSLFNTVGNAATQINNAIENVGDGLDMLNRYVKVAKVRQKAEMKANMASYFKSLKERTLVEDARRELELAEELAQNPALKTIYQRDEAAMDELLKPLMDEWDALHL